MNISKRFKLARVANAAAAGQTAVTSSSVDMKGFDTALFVVAMGSITGGAVTSVKAQGSANDSDWTDLEGTSIAIADSADNKLTYVEVSKPQHRYLRVVVSRATQDSVVDGIIAVLGMAQVEPVTHDTTVAGGELHHAPAVGTA